MRIEVHEGRMSFNGDAVRYDERYLKAADFKDAFREWIHRIGANVKPVRLPFSIDDEYVEAFEVESLDEGEVELRVVRLDNIGYAHGVDSLMDSLVRELPVVARFPQPFLVCRRRQLLEAVKDWLSGTQ